MSDLLALNYRPKRFEDLSYQPATKLILSQMVKFNKVPAGLLFSGHFGAGKTSSARILAAAINCVEDSPPCGKCVSCESIFDCISPDVIEFDAASNGGVAKIRELIDILPYRSSGQKRIIILDECHVLSREAFNALLKTLEEPPTGTVFILVTTTPKKLPDTILSRLMSFEFRAIPVEYIAARLKFICEKELIKADFDLIQEIAARSKGSMRDALMVLDQLSRSDITTLVSFYELHGETDFGPDLVKIAISGNVASVFDLVESVMPHLPSPDAVADVLVSTLREILVLRAGGALERQGVGLSTRLELAALLEPDRAFAGLKVMWDLRNKTRVHENPRIALDLALVMVTEALSGKIHHQKKIIPKLSLEEMKDL